MLKDIINRINKPLLLIFLGAFLLRALGAVHGFPFITHPDEATIVRSTTGMMFDPNPGHFDWPHLQYYINFVVYFLFIKFRGLMQILGLRPAIEGFLPLIWRDPLVFYFLSRLVSSFMAALTVIPVYYAGKALFSKRVGLLAAVAIAIMPFHMWHSHYTLSDSTMAFWASIGLYFSALILKKPDLKNYIFAGLFVGFAASTKYNGGLSALMVFVAHLLRVYNSKDEDFISFDGFKLLVVSGLFAVFGFVIGTPFSVLDSDTFLRSDHPNGALWQFANVGSVDKITQAQQFATNLATKLPDDFGITFLPLYLVTFFYTIFAFLKNGKKSFTTDKSLWLFIIPSFFLFWYISGFEKTRSHYYLVTYPFVALSVGFVCNYIIENVKKKWVVYALVGLIYLIPLVYTLKNAVVLVRPDTRNVLYEWMLQNVEDDDSIIYDSKDIDPVIAKFDKQDTTRNFSPEYLELNSGWIILSNREPIELYGSEDYVELNGLRDETIFEVSPKLQHGPYIIVLPF